MHKVRGFVSLHAEDIVSLQVSWNLNIFNLKSRGYNTCNLQNHFRGCCIHLQADFKFVNENLNKNNW